MGRTRGVTMEGKNFDGRYVSAALLSLLLVMLFVLPSQPYMALSSGYGFETGGIAGTGTSVPAVLSVRSAIFDYNSSLALKYAYMIHSKYYHTTYYPAGINESIMQKNLDKFNSEDCAHFVSESLIAGGLTALARSPPADNLSGYDNGAFVGSYGIVGVYRLADYLAGYDLPVFPNNATAEKTMGYQPIPASYAGSPNASVYYVTNDSILPSYLLSPGDVVVDGGAGSGHVMLYAGNGNVLQTDPANEWAYAPGVDYNISFYGLLTLNGKNVSALYMHMPTFSGPRYVTITALHDGAELKAGSAHVPGDSAISLIASFPDGVGYGNYSYRWSVDGHLVSTNQIFTFHPSSGANTISVVSTGSSGNATASYTIFVPPPKSTGPSATSMLLYSSVAAVIAASSVIIIRKTRR